MAKEHHCPNCGPQACNASTSRIHTCGVCAAVWDEVLTETPAAAAPTPPKPAPTAPAAPPKPATPAPAAAPASPATKAAPPPGSTPAAAAPVPAKAVPAPAPAATAPKPAASPAPPPAQPQPARDPRNRRLTEVVAAAKVKRCPACTSDSLASPGDFVDQGGRIALLDSQSYFGHRWYADTGEVLADARPPRPAPAPPASTVKTSA